MRSVKWYIAILVCWLFSMGSVEGQADCEGGGGGYLYTQSQLDSFITMYSHCEDLSSKWIVVYDNEEMDYSGLDIFKSLGLAIRGDNSTRRVLDILNQTEDIGVRIAKFPDLEEIRGFDRVQTIPVFEHGSKLFFVESCPKLRRIDAFPVLERGQLEFWDLPSLEVIDGFDRLDRLEKLTFEEFEAGQKIDFLPHVSSINLLTMNGCGTDLLSGLGNIDSVRSLGFYNSDGLMDLDPLSHFRQSQDTSWFDNWDFVRIVNNSGLSDCSIPLVCEILEKEEDYRVWINQNASGCNSIAEVKSACAAREGCTPPSGEIILSSQSDVDSLGMKYRSCDRIYGDVHIIGDWDLGALDHFRHFGGLRITGMAGDRLAGLDSLATVGWLSIEENPYLEEIVGLSNLRYTRGRLRLYRNPRLRRPAFPSLREVGRLEISVYGGRDLRGLDSLWYCHGGLMIQNCGSLEGLSGLDSVKRISRVLNLHNNRSLEDISVLGDKDLSTIEELTITVNPSLSICHQESICKWLEEVSRFDYVNIQSNADGCKSESEVLMSCGVIDATEEIEEVGLQLYPNPTSGLLHIETEVAYDGVVIYDVRGRRLYRFGELEIIDLRGYLVEGMYWLHLQKDGAIVGSGTFMKVE